MCVFILLQPVLLSISYTLYGVFPSVVIHRLLHNVASSIFNVQLFRHPKFKYMHSDNKHCSTNIPDAQKGKKASGFGSIPRIHVMVLFRNFRVKGFLFESTGTKGTIVLLV